MPRKYARSVRNRSSLKRRLQYELLESRRILASDLAGNDSFPQTVGPMNWFESFPSVDRVSLESLASVDKSLPAGIAGPVEPAVGEWIVQLTDSAAKSLRTLSQGNALLNQTYGDFTIISGLGIEGLLLVRGRGATKSVLESSLSLNENVQSFSLNQLIQGQSTTPNDPEFVAGLMPGMERIDATNAWDVSRGSSSTVVGVVDTGIDPTHPDLYLNIWLNQGELPKKYLDDDGPKLVDIDNDGLITFYDLNNVTRSSAAPYSLVFGGFASGTNASFVSDLNSNGRIDATDLLADANWADGRDTDNNGFFDDFFGVNFRTGAGDPFASNNPSDELGHGTHVAGTIGAIGGNATGVVGVNWQTSLMSLRILDNNNQGDSGAAIRAINYAREMRERYRVEPNGRVSEGANVRVLNNSWGQPGGFEISLEAAIQDSSDAGILFVAASGNGNFLGQGVDNDRTPFYPASYEVDGVIAVAALDTADRTASFSNYGANSVDLLAPGVGIRSTLPGGGYGSANGTSMATPHVAGTAALIWSAFPEATVDEIQRAILTTVDPITNGNLTVATGGRLSASKAINADVFAPSAKLIAKQDVTTAGGVNTEFTVEYKHRSGIDTTTIGNDDLIVTRQWGQKDQLTATLKANSIVQTSNTATAVYIVSAPGGSWDALDFGDYVISTIADKVTSKIGNKTIEARDIGLFNVRVNDPSVLYVNSFADSLEPGTLRGQIIAANAATPAPRTIILESGRYTIDIPSVVDPSSTFPNPEPNLYCGAREITTGWSNETTGDFDIVGNITIVGNSNDLTAIDGNQLSRVFKVHPLATLSLSRLTITGGVSPSDQGGGGILSVGTVTVSDSNVQGNRALAVRPEDAIRGGGIASWDGTTDISRSWISDNKSNYGAGVFYCGDAGGTISQSTISNNLGGGLHSHSDTDLNVTNSTFSGNDGGRGAIYNGKRDGFGYSISDTRPSAIDAQGRFVTFASASNNLVYGDNNSLANDIFVYDRQRDTFERVNVSNSGNESNDTSYDPRISQDGRFVAFASEATNLVPNDTNRQRDVFVYDRDIDSIERISLNNSGIEGSSTSLSPSISADGRFVAFISFANNFVPYGGPGAGFGDVYIYDRQSDTIEHVSQSVDGNLANGASKAPAISADGRFVAYWSAANNLADDDTNGLSDIFVYDRENKITKRIAIADPRPAFGFNSEVSLSVSGNGQFLAFESSVANLVPGDTNGVSDVFVYDRSNESMQRVSVSSVGLEGNNRSQKPSISEDGRFIAFDSLADNLDQISGGGEFDVFVYDRGNSSIKQVTDNSGRSDAPLISADGRVVTFGSLSTRLIPNDLNNDLNNTYDIFLHDRSTQVTSSPTVSTSSSIINVSQATVAYNTGTEFSVLGRVRLTDVLQSNEIIGISTSGITSTNTIKSLDAGSNLILPLSRNSQLPPVHALSRGNPAVDSGSTSFSGGVDQRGVTRVTPDVGAYEGTSALISGSVFADLNKDQVYSSDETGVSSVEIRVFDSTAKRIQTVFSSIDNESTLQINETGRIDLGELAAGDYAFEIVAPTGFASSVLPISRVPSVQPNKFAASPSLSFNGRFAAFTSNASNLVLNDTNSFDDVFVFDRKDNLVKRVSVSSNGIQSNNGSASPALSADGRYVAFQSGASNLVQGDTNGLVDIFVYDLQSGVIERVNKAENGSQPNDQSFSPSISDDGRFIAYESRASNLVSNDSNSVTDIFIYDRQLGTTERVSIGVGNTNANDQSFTPKLSGDGRFVAFSSSASNLVDGDTNNRDDIFVYERVSRIVERVSINSSGIQGNDGSSSPSISRDGKFVAFVSNSLNLVPEKTESNRDVFVFDRQTRTTERVSISKTGGQADRNSSSGSPSISGDGRFVVYISDAANLVPGDTNTFQDTFLFDRRQRKVERVSVGSGGVEGNGHSLGNSLVISGDGRSIGFSSFASNLIVGDTNNLPDIFVAPNPLIEPGFSRSFAPGESIADLNFGLIPNPGTISGRVFEDGVSNGVLDQGEPTLTNAFVFLDLNSNRIFDAGEPSVTTASDGTYQFLNTDSFRSYVIVARVPIGFEQVAPSASDNFAWNIFLPAGGTVTDRDFALRRVQSTGQSSASAVSGRLYDDRNGNGVYDAGDNPIVNREVYLDATNFGVRDTNEPRVLTDAQGRYSIDGLSSRTVAVTTTLDDTLVHVTPLGSSFAVQTFPLFSSIRPFSNPQAIATGDFNQDGALDVAMALGEANKLSIRLNNGLGGFLATEIDIDLGSNGTGPTSLVVGQFDNDSKLDVALTANYSSKVIVLLNYNPTTRTFASQSAVNVGLLPIDLVIGQFGGDSALDLAVVNQGSGAVASTVQLLTNNGSGGFTAGAAIPTGGKTSVSIVAGSFAGDASTDIAIVHASPSTTNTPNGGVTVLRGNGAGGLTLEPSYYQVGALPIDSVTADFNGDGRMDLAVANFSSNSISILLGQANGNFRVQTAILGTASGAFDITVGDIDNDSDLDVIASNLRDRNISIFRNIGVDLTTGDVRFEPLENVGLGQFALAQRMPLVVGNFDNDRSGPGGTGTLDIVTIPQRTDTLHVLKNKLVNGSRRVALTGTNSISGLDFIIKPAILPPSFDEIANPVAVVEDATEQTIQIRGVKKGRATGPSLRFTASSSNPLLVASPSVSFVDGSASATLRYTTLPNANGTTVVTVRAVDAGADQVFDTSDDGVLDRSFTVTVLAVNDPPTFVVPSETSVPQKADNQSLAGFVTGIISGGGPDEASQTLSAFTVIADASFFTVQPTISSTGTLTFTPNPDKSGIVPVSVKLSDNGGVTNGGFDSTIRNFVINVLPVNDPPTFNLGGNLSIQMGAGLQTLSNFANGFGPGGGSDEADQVISDYVVTVDASNLFTTAPSINTLGTLTFTPSSDRTGVALVSVRVRDNGGTLNGGIDLSSVKSFTITVNAVPDTIPPTPLLTSTASAFTNISPINVAIDFGEVVTRFALNDLVLINATASNLVDVGGGKFTASIAPIADGEVRISIPAAAVMDLAGNNSLASALLTRTIDRVVPAVSISTAEPNPTTRSSFPITIQFSEPVTGFDLSDLVVGNCIVSNLSETTPGNYVATLTANSDGVVLVGFSAGVARDAAGNGNTAPIPLLISVNTGSATYKPLLTTGEPSPTSKRTFAATIDFGRVVSGFDASDLDLANATATVTDLGTGRYRLSLSAINEGDVSVRVAADRVRDANNRPNDATDVLTVRFVDTSNSDFGDAPTAAQSGLPASYPTLLKDNGAFHKRSALVLGTSSDAEPEGLPNATATGDGVDDEDGILFPITNVIGVSTVTTSSFVAISSGTGFIDAWIDFNHDGDWTDSGEQIASKVAVVAGSNSIVFTIPVGAAAGTTFGRFRLSSAGGLVPTGLATDGEVEDHSITLVSGATKSLTITADDLGSHSIAIVNASFTITSGGRTVWSAPVAEISKLTLLDSSAARLFEVTNPATNLPGQIKYTGVGKPIELVSDRSSIDLSVLSSDKLFGIGLIDLRAVGTSSLAFQASNISAINGSKTLRILMDREDALSAPGNWLAQTGRLENGVWVQPFTNAGAKIEVISATPWQNKVNLFDVDGDLTLSPLDVLVLVNLINNSTFQNGQLPARGSTQPDGFFDPDGDNSLGPLDVLTLINEINRGGAAGGEGEKRSQWVDEVMATELGDWGVEIRPVGLARRKLGNRR